MTDDPKPATRKNVAELSGVSGAVVSYVVNGGPRPVSAQTRERVLAAMQELNYRPNAAARALRLRRTNAIGLILPDISNPYFGEFAKAIEDAAFDRGFALILGNSSNDPDREAAQLDSFIDRQVDGLLVISVRRHAELSIVRDAQIPLVVIDQPEKGVDLPTVVIDNYRGARAAVEHLRSHGHRRIGLIGGPPLLPGSRARQAGWRDALNEIGDGQGVQAVAPFTRLGGLEAGLQLLSGPDRPSALFVSSDIQSIGVLRACAQLDLRVPDEVALISFDGTQAAEFTAPPLTVIHQPVDLIATAALDMLLAPTAQHKVVPYTLIPRASCGC
ncbi:LacI family DNA-binding transcriptional regulator [Fodinicola feengrottensis]|uniref:LacI family DNA-binding transcriptional regulator n=1 Tax=Fodinicola feengrottensis TaxID=435914 RepID=A0ABP4RW06_9ACTN